VNEVRSNAEIVFETLAAYERGDEETVRARMHPEVEIYSEPGMINAGSFTGFEGFRQWASQWEEAWEEISYEPVEFIDVDDSRLIVRTHVRGRGAGSGLEIDRDFAYLYEIRDGRATRFHLYDSVDSAREAAGRLDDR
jgi:ketosteroid isomerase-like protein